jgi:hypothetical protein
MPIAFYSWKPTSPQTRYTTAERELLAIVETLQEFPNILLGQKIIVHTDHKNLTHQTFITERVMRWRRIKQEYGPEFLYVKGEHNVVADALSKLSATTASLQNTSLCLAECFGISHQVRLSKNPYSSAAGCSSIGTKLY